MSASGPNSRGCPGPPADRGQTPIDFTVGAGILLVTVAFVFAFVPGMFGPYVDGTRPGAADRTVSALATDALASPEEPYVLDRSCTVDFFAHFRTGASADDACRFDTDAATVPDALGHGETTEVNVSIRTQSGALASLDGVTLAVGEDHTRRSNVATARRTVYLDGQSHRLVVALW